MGKKVYANDMEIAHQSGDAKVIAAFPDVCLSPPPPPAGPVPIPYPNTSFAKDLSAGSHGVTIGGKPLALQDQSYYATSPLGDEAATRNFGGSVVTHTITGKTFFQAFSMDVKVEGKNVCRHLDITTSNHASQPGSTPPMPNAEGMTTAAAAEPQCDCCHGPAHSEAQKRDPMGPADYYQPKADGPMPNKRERAAFGGVQTLKAMAKADGCDKQILHPDDSKDPCARHYPASAAENRKATEEYEAMMNPMTPDEYFTGKYGAALGNEIQERGRRMNAALKGGAKSIAHKTPRSGGGCPIGENNLAPVEQKCAAHEDMMGRVQGDIALYHRRANGL